MAINRYADLAHSIFHDEIGTAAPSHLAFVDFLYAGGVQFHEVQQPEEGRLDLISYVYFEDVRWWELIGWMNNIVDPLRDVKRGTILVIPVDPISVTRDLKAFSFLEVA